MWSVVDVKIICQNHWSFNHWHTKYFTISFFWYRLWCHESVWLNLVNLSIMLIETLVCMRSKLLIQTSTSRAMKWPSPLEMNVWRNESYAFLLLYLHTNTYVCSRYESEQIAKCIPIRAVYANQAKIYCTAKNRF